MKIVKNNSQLYKLMNILDEKRNESGAINYTVPEIWNIWGYLGKEMIKTNEGEYKVNPYNFYYEIINSYILPKKLNDKDYNKPYQEIVQTVKPNDEKYLGGDWIKESVVYSMMVRTSTSWDHDKSGDLENFNLHGLKETGTFIKTLVLLPLLKKMGVDVVYLLPISKYSIKNKKGELGSPYGVANFYELDPNLKDPITGNALTVEDEFEAFVEACHILGMKVMIDIIPRTNAIENDLIVSHPDWFYWIKCEEFDNYKPPVVPTLGFTSPKPDVLSHVYQSEAVWEHIHKFSYDPKTIDPEKYNRLVKEQGDNFDDFSEVIKREFNVQIAPAFSDHINDTQPPWTDITFFRMYKDHPTLTQQELQKYLKANEELPPYILFDTIKCNYYQGNVPNIDLWNTLSDIIPYYQKRFGIDGARIDMGHALSSNLLEMIINKARSIDPHFCFIAEELDVSIALKSRQLGYNMIIGAGFMDEPHYKTGKLQSFVYNAYKHACPIFACGETHDTPRLASREGGRTLSNMLAILNMFIPNTVPFINSGQEVYERQPINTGLDVNSSNLSLLEPNDPYYNKLALFDKFAIHYLNDNYLEIPNHLEIVSEIRNNYIETLTNTDNYFKIDFMDSLTHCIGFGYIEEGKRLEEQENTLLILANPDPHNEANITVDLKSINNKALKGSLLFSQYKKNNIMYLHDNKLKLHLEPGEINIIKL